ncbi:DUF1493 family protein [Brenneria tiliae]|uniref:DUF1493 family protein n=1 Tax=Brenneria tiliae TaxID=2914984 RepID=A0ABT0MYR4_9GAMM|nr:DUF1493 family protein [Brenneria tiliae]MCL2894999.1 DUF1493 family protein [Brenneria tiliae]MCL2895903.1 DUF1493 family protein [Brenneria tiliae]MCL2900444.1 DUF1493 family protein [Brenneria tiliae]
MSNVVEDNVRAFVKGELPLVTTLFKKVDVDDDAVLQELHEADDIAEMTKRYFDVFSVDPNGFALINYYPWKPRTFFTGKSRNRDKQALTIRMYIESAKAGRWLYD